MSKNKMLKRISCAAMTVILAFACIACSGSPNVSSNNTGTASNTPGASQNTGTMQSGSVYTAESLSIPGSVSNVSNIVHSGDAVYVLGNSINGDDMAQKLYSVKLDGSGHTEVDISQLIENATVSAFTADDSALYFLTQTSSGMIRGGGTARAAGGSFSIGSNASGGMIINGMPGADSNEDSDTRLVKLDISGNTVIDISLQEHLSQGGGMGFSNQIILDDDGNIIVMNGSAILVFDKDGSFLFKVDNNETMISSLLKSSDGSILAQIYDANAGGFVLKALDIAGKQISSDSFSTPSSGIGGVGGGISFGMGQTLMSGAGGGDTTILLNDSNCVYSYNYLTQEKTELLNWVDSDINAENVSIVLPISDTQLVYSGFSMMDFSTEISLLTKVNPEDLANQQVITLAITENNVELRSAVIEFNKSNPNYRIKLIDYTSHASTNAIDGAAEKLNSDIIAGNIPDMFMVGENLPFPSYAQKGLLADIYQLMDSDADINREDFLENILRAWSSGEKLYRIAPSFSIDTVIGKSDTIDGKTGWTLGEFEELDEAVPEGSELFYDMTRDRMLESLLDASLSSFINSESGQCSFNSEAFIRLLEHVNTYPEETTDDSNTSSVVSFIGVAGIGGGRRMNSIMSDFSVEEAIRSGKVFLRNYTLNDIRAYQRELFVFGGDVSFVGYPTAEANGSIIRSDMMLALSAKSSNLQGAWEFVKYLLSYDYQTNLRENLPLSAAALDELGRLATLPNTYTTDEGEEVTIPDMYFTMGERVEMDLLTQAQVDTVISFIKSVDQASTDHSDVLPIVYEEIGAFFAGQKSAADTASIIQSRAQTYISEQR